MTEEEELEYLQLKAKAAGLPAMSHTGDFPNIPVRQPSKLSDIPAGAQAGLEDLLLGAKQRFYEMTGNPQAEALREFVKTQRQAQEKEELLKGPKSLAFGGSQIAAKTAPFMAASMVPGGSTITGSVALGALQGALEPSASMAETLRNTGLAGVSSGVTSGAVRAVAPRPKVEPETRALAEAADREGMPLFGGQRSGVDYVKRAEAHGYWNPMTRAVAQWKGRRQTDEFVRQILERSGMPADIIPKNPSLSPEILDTAHKLLGREFDKNFLGTRIPATRFDSAFVKANDIANKFFHVNKEAREFVRDVASGVLAWKVPNPNIASYKGEQVQDLLEQVKSSVEKAYKLGDKPAGDAIKSLYNDLVRALPDPELYRKTTQQFANLETAQDLLRSSRGIGAGTPDAERLSRVIERNFKGGVVRNYSDLADLARAGEATKLPGALPERVTGLPRPSDIANALTFYRFNNPAATAGMRNPRTRDLAEALLRYLPFAAGAAEEPAQWGGELYRRGAGWIGGKK